MKATKTRKEKDTRDDILAHLKSDDRRMTWLSQKTEIPYTTLYSIFKKKERTLQQHQLDVINKVLGTDFKL